MLVVLDRLMARVGEVERSANALDFPTRLEIERAVFAVAKATAARRYALELTGLNDLQERSVADRVPGENGVVNAAFAVRRLLESLAGFDPYVTYELDNRVLQGRREMIAGLISLLRRFVAAGRDAV